MYAVVDIETTGGRFNEEAITEIAVYRFDGHEVVDQFASLVNPERPIQPFVQKLTGINEKCFAMLRAFLKLPNGYRNYFRLCDCCPQCRI